jgi:hypothetical protein
MLFNNISKYLQEFTQFGVFYKKKLLYIPKDTRIHKYTFFIKYPTCGKTVSDKQFLDIYNCASYELIPFIKIKQDNIIMNIGNIYVQLRFLFIDLWLLNLLKKLEVITDIIYHEKYINILDTIKLLKQKMPNGIINTANNYIGINIDEKVSKQIFISKNNIKRISYYPELSIKENNKYQIMATSA